MIAGPAFPARDTYKLLQGPHTSRVRSAAARWLASRPVNYFSIFLPLFALCFLWLRLVGPLKLVGYWIRHEFLSTLSSVTVAFLVALDTRVTQHLVENGLGRTAHQKTAVKVKPNYRRRVLRLPDLE